MPKGLGRGYFFRGPDCPLSLPSSAPSCSLTDRTCSTPFGTRSATHTPITTLTPSREPSLGPNDGNLSRPAFTQVFPTQDRMRSGTTSGHASRGSWVDRGFKSSRGHSATEIRPFACRMVRLSRRGGERRRCPPWRSSRLPLFVLDHEQRRGFVVWDASWVGGSLKLRRTDADWEVETVEDRIT